MNLKYNRKNYKSNLVEFSDERYAFLKALYIIFNNYFLILYNVKKQIFMPLMWLLNKNKFLGLFKAGR